MEQFLILPQSDSISFNSSLKKKKERENGTVKDLINNSYKDTWDFINLQLHPKFNQKVKKELLAEFMYESQNSMGNSPQKYMIAKSLSDPEKSDHSKSSKIYKQSSSTFFQSHFLRKKTRLTKQIEVAYQTQNSSRKGNTNCSSFYESSIMRHYNYIPKVLEQNFKISSWKF